jgi:hypothetical protein
MENANIIDRHKSLQWWKSLFSFEQTALIKKHFPNTDTILISTSSSKIEMLWKLEGRPKPVGAL